MSQILLQYSDNQLHGLNFPDENYRSHADFYGLYTSLTQLFNFRSIPVVYLIACVFCSLFCMSCIRMLKIN